MSYQILAHKYRPQTFDDVIGQETVTRTLKNSIKNGRVANAYIFCGPRGVGKTTVARLVSKMLNCENPLKDGPCNKCAQCREINSGSSIDVLEIDGASNRGIDEIRTLRENVKFMPSAGKFKVYIIDEVHMLTTEAFNALLKTLEEPPPHVKFIFATTESHKVLPTIMSRCQRFDFKRIPPKLTYERIMFISGQEKIDIDEKAALLIARSSDGSLRDGLVILDQMISFSDGKISRDDVLELLGMVHRESIFRLSLAIIGNDPVKVALLIDELINSGKDPVFITNNLIGHFRDLMILKTAGNPTADMAFSKDELDEMKGHAGKVSLEETLYILQNLSQCLLQMKGTLFTRAPLEITLIKLTRRGDVLAVRDILDRLEKLPVNTGEKPFDPAEPAASPPAADFKKSTGPAMTDEKERVEERMTRAQGPAGDGLDENTGPDEEDPLNDEKLLWESVLNYVKSRKMSVYTFLSHAKPVEFNKKRVILGFGQNHGFNKEVLEAKDNKDLIKEGILNVLGVSPKLEFKVLEFLGGSSEEGTVSRKKAAKIKESLNPHIQKVIDVFGGHIIRDNMEGNR